MSWYWLKNIVGKWTQYGVFTMAASCLMITSVQASNGVSGKNAFHQLELRSEATATWLFMDIYNAYLYAPADVDEESLLKEEIPLKLRLCYLHKITKSDFIEAASEALPQKLSTPLAQAVQGLHNAYQDVKPNDCYQLSYTESRGVMLSLNDKALFQTKTQGFKALYFGIWLGPNPLSDTVKQELLAPFID